MIWGPLNRTIADRVAEFEAIPAERKQKLLELARFVDDGRKAGRPVRLNFICTHNSRRSHMAQLWAQAAAHYYGIEGVACYSGGTEATAFHPQAVKAMQDAGFRIESTTSGVNPRYVVTYGNDAAPVTAFSKKYDDPSNPSGDFAAVMTCSEADANCPVVIGAARRISLTYEDPKAFDGTPQAAEGYAARVRQIGREMLFAFSRVPIQGVA